MYSIKNQTALMGAVAKDPEIVSGETMIANIVVKAGGQNVAVKAFGKTAEFVRDYIKAGDTIGVVGSIRVDSWTDNDGQKRSKLSVTVADLQTIRRNGEAGDDITMNDVVVIGRLGADVEPKTTSSGKTVASFSVAVTSGNKDNPRTDWIPVTAWNPKACPKKGDLVVVTGAIRNDRFEKDGKTTYRTYVNAESVSIGKAAGVSKPAAAKSDVASDYETLDNPDDLPF